MLHCNPEFLHVVRPKTPRGDGNFLPHAWATAFDQVVRPKTPRGDGNHTSVARHTPTNHQVVRPKTPRGDGNFSDHLCGISGLRSSDPKPREGTETGQRSTPALVDFRVVRPKTPRGDGNLRRASTRGCRLRWSSDPKPREGTETSSTIIAIPSPHVSSDPKPREGTETWDICCPPGEMLSEVVRPKTPRGDGNLRQPFRCDADGRLGSSDPKPREGTETLNNAQ
ncbi:Uncharacterised protein [Mycobacterium tuberculosis]|nr:Uncharacterised protein [Mycobacterium tuberculosis]